MTLDSARGSDGCEASPRLPTGLCGSRIRTDDSLYVSCSRVLLLDDRLAADGHGGAGAGLGVEVLLPRGGVLPVHGRQQVQGTHLAQRVEDDETRGGVGSIPRDRGPQAVLTDEELAAVAVVQVVVRGLGVALGGP